MQVKERFYSNVKTDSGNDSFMISSFLSSLCFFGSSLPVMYWPSQCLQIGTTRRHCTETFIKDVCKGGGLFKMSTTLDGDKG